YMVLSLSLSIPPRPTSSTLFPYTTLFRSMEAQEALLEEGIDTRVVSMPSWDRFEQQTDAYKESVLPQDVSKRLAIEMAASFGWERYTGLAGDILAIDRFGASAKGDKVVEEYGFTVENVIAKVKNLK